MKELSGTGSPLTGVIMPMRSRRSTSTSELDYARPNDWFGNSKWKNEFLKKVIMPAGAGTGDRMRIVAVVRS